MALIELKNICKSYPLDGFTLNILKKISLSIEQGEFVAIMGPSGSGKSTLMNILGCLDKPSSGQYLLDGRNVEKLSADELAAIRNQKIGFVFQGFNLLSRTSALENVELPMVYSNVPAEERERRAKEALKKWGWSAGCIISRASFPAGSSNGLQLRAPSLTRHRLFLPMSRRETSIPK